MGGSKTKLAADIERLQQQQRADPSSPEFHRLADLYTRVGRYEDAVGLCEHGLSRHPTSALGLAALGRAFFGQGNLADATEVLSKALSLDDRKAEPYRLLGEVLMRRGRSAEAAALLQKAMDKGLVEPKIAALAERAQMALDHQQTQVTTLPEEPRGIGNRAIAGSIEGDEEKTPRVVPVEVTEPTRRVAAPGTGLVITEGDDAKTRTIAAPPETGGQRRLAPDWSAVGSQWEEQLDAGLGEEGPPADSDLRGPFMRRGVGLALSPLADPLAEDMPPLPPEALMTQEVDTDAAPEALMTQEVDTGAAEIDERTRELQRAQGFDVLDSDETATLTEEVVAIEPDNPFDAEPMGETLPPLPMPAAPQQVPQHVSVQALAAAADEVATSFREVGKVTPGDAEPGYPLGPASFDSSPTLESGRYLTEPVLPETGDSSLEPVTTPPASRRRGWLSALLLLTLLGVGGYYGWHYYQTHGSSGRLVAAAVEARRDGSAAALAGAGSRLAHDPSGAGLAGEGELLAALGWLVHREGSGRPAKGESAHWPAVAARAALAISERRVDQAKRLLKGTLASQPPANQGLGYLLLAWAGWVAGDVEAARADCERALAKDPRLALAWVLRGHLEREAGQLTAAAKAYGEARRLAPKNRLAALGLAATLMGQADEVAHSAAPAAETPSAGAAEGDAGGAAEGDAGGGAEGDAGGGAEGDAGGAAEGDAGGIAKGGGKAALDSQRIESLLAEPGAGRVGKAWARVLGAELELRTSASTKKAGKGLAELLGELPPEPAVLLDGIEALRLACDFDAARNLHGRLAQVRQRKAAAFRTQEALLALAEGTPSLAARHLADVERPSARVIELRALALVLAGRGEQASSVLKSAGDSATTLRLVVDALAEPTRPLAPLERRVVREPLAGLGLTLVLLARSQWAAAEAVARSSAVRLPWRGRALTYVARALAAQGKRAAAFDTLRQVQRSCPGYLPARELLGASLVHVGAYEEGARLLAGAKDRGRATASLLANLVRAYAELGRKNAALTALGELQRAGGMPGTLRLAEGFVRLAEGQPKAALVAFRLADPSFAAHLGSGRALRAIGHQGAAARSFTKAAALDASHPLPHLYLGQLHRDAQAKAFRHLKRAIELTDRDGAFPRWLKARSHIGIAEASDDDGAVVKHLRAAIAAEPSSGQAYRLLGEHQLDLGKLAAARAALKKAVQINPDDASAWHLLGLASGRNRRAAREAFERFLALEPKGKRAQAVRRRLVRLR